MFSPRENIIKFLIFMVAGSHLIWLFVISLIGWEFISESYVGMSAPLWVGVISLARMHAIFETIPEALTAFMTKAFFGKMIFYAILIVTIVRFSAFNTVIFIGIFTGFFIALLGVEAAFLKNIFKNKK